MKNTLTIIAVLYAVFSAFLLHAQPVSVNAAREIARKRLTVANRMSDMGSLKSAERYSAHLVLADISIDSMSGDVEYYIFNDELNGGFVIVAADERIFPVLAYSTVDNYTKTDQPPGFIQWMDHLKSEIAAIKKSIPSGYRKSGSVQVKMQDADSAAATLSVDPLLKTQWNQGCYYNTMCPEDKDGPCNHCVAGCVATATAQIMKYWNYPLTGNGSLSYNHQTYGTLSADFGKAVYQWNLMPDKVKKLNDAVAALIYHCGVSVKMDFSPSSSSAYDPKDELVKYFNYSPGAKYIRKSSYSGTTWVKMITDELTASRPVWYSGDGSGSHAFVCDGFQDSDFFHFNWGWGGHYDGYFYLGSLNPGEYDFTSTQNAIIKIHPGSVPLAAGTIEGPDSVCQGQSMAMFSVPPVPGASSYVWTLPSGASGNSDTRTISVYFSLTAQEGSIRVKGRNELGEGEESSMEITVSQLPVQTGQIAGATSVCRGDLQTYSVDGMEGVKHKWTFPEGWVPLTGENGNSVTVRTGSGSGNITVVPSNRCGNGIAKVLEVITTESAPVMIQGIKGKSSVCQGDLQTFSVEAIPGVTYEWSFPQGWVPTVGTSSNQVSVIPGSESGTITVTPWNGCGKGASKEFGVIAEILPSGMEQITGPALVCSGDSVIYSVPGVEGVHYEWGLPEGWESTNSGSGHSVIAVAGPLSGSVKVTPSNSCGKGKTEAVAVTSGSIPPDPGIIIGQTEVHLGENLKYSVAGGEGTTYHWAFPKGWIQTEGGTSNSVFVTAGAGTGDISVFPTNRCGKGTASVLNVSDVIIDFSKLYQDIHVYPNPVTSLLKIEMKGYGTLCRFSILNLIGQTLYRSEIESVATVDMSSFRSGIYMIKFEIKNSFLLKKFVKL